MNCDKFNNTFVREVYKFINSLFPKRSTESIPQFAGLDLGFWNFDDVRCF